MRFIKFNYRDGSSFCFCLDDLISFETDAESTGIVLRSGREETLPINVDDFATKIFSDEHGENEYQLIEIDEDGIRPSTVYNPNRPPLPPFSPNG